MIEIHLPLVVFLGLEWDSLKFTVIMRSCPFLSVRRVEDRGVISACLADSSCLSKFYMCMPWWDHLT